jgi:non-specific serine/threonine protein kinase
LFAALSVFPDWFDAAAAQEIAPPAEAASVIPGLVRLVDASLLSVVESGNGRLRYRMLETLRQSGREQLRRTGDENAAVGRFVNWAVRFAERAERELLGPEEPRWVRRVEVEFANLRAAWNAASNADDVVSAARIAVALSEHAMQRCVSEPWTWAIATAQRPDLSGSGCEVAVLGAAAQAS